MASIADMVKKEVKKYLGTTIKPKSKSKKKSKPKSKKRKGSSISGQALRYADRFLSSGQAKNRSQAMKMAWRYIKGR